MSSYESYYKTVEELRSLTITEMKQVGFDRHYRVKCNDILHNFCKYSVRQYLYAFNDHCQLCGHRMITIKFATLDHIIPKALGGSDKAWNMQLAHPWCNVLKADSLNWPKPVQFVV